jgi:hypothetical protein
VAVDSSKAADMAIKEAVSIPESQTPSVMQQQLQSEGMLVDTGSNKQTIQSYTADTFDDLEGDDLLDALLSMDDDTTDDTIATGSTTSATLALPWQTVSNAIKTAAPTAAATATVEDVIAVQEELSHDEVTLLLSTPELSALCEHLNDRHRSAKQLSTQCQELFLRLYFMVSASVRSLLHAIASKTRQHSSVYFQY